MSKRSIATLNCFLAVVLFLCVFGNLCYESAFWNKDSTSESGEYILRFLHFAIFTGICVCCPFLKTENLQICLWICAIYSILYPLERLFHYTVARYPLIDTPSAIQLIMLILPIVLFGLYIFAALKTDQESEQDFD